MKQTNKIIDDRIKELEEYIEIHWSNKFTRLEYNAKIEELKVLKKRLDEIQD